MQPVGNRAIATGVGILMADDPQPWIYGRVGGDALDLAGFGWSIEHGREPAKRRHRRGRARAEPNGYSQPLH